MCKSVPDQAPGLGDTGLGSTQNPGFCFLNLTHFSLAAKAQVCAGRQAPGERGALILTAETTASVIVGTEQRTAGRWRPSWGSCFAI